MRHVSKIHRVCSVDCLNELIWTPKCESNLLTPETNSLTCWLKDNFTRDDWSHLLRLFNMKFLMLPCSPFLSMKKRTPCAQERRPGEELVVAKWRPWVWYQEVWPWINLPCWIWSATHNRESQAQRDLCGTGQNPNTEMRILFQNTERWISVQIPENRDVKYRMNLQRSRNCGSTQVFANLWQNWTVQKTTRKCRTKKSMNWFGWRTLPMTPCSTGTPTSRRSRHCSTSRRKLTLNQKCEIKHVSTIEWQFTLDDPLCCITKAIKLSQRYTSFKSVLCLGKMHGHLGCHDKDETTLLWIQEKDLESMKNHLSLSRMFSLL